MAKIQDDNILYSLLKPFVDYHLRKSFRRYKVVGQENIPQDAACIFGANHTNTLMDALVLLSMNKEKKVFIARGDIFKKPFIAKLMYFCRILPIYRIRDGFKSVKDNNSEIIDKAADVVRDNVKLFLYPEAAHRTKHSLRQLSKGIFHIALEANRQFGHEKPVYIVPTGIEYGDYFRYRSTALISFGEPINVTEFINQHKDENEALLMNGLRDSLAERMAARISFIPDSEENYDAIWELTKIKAGCKGGLEERLERNQKTIKEILEWKEREPEKAQALLEKVNKFIKKRKKKGISVTSVAKDKPYVAALWKSLVAVLGLPLYIASALATLPIWVVTMMLKGSFKDKAWGNTVSFGVETILHPLMMVLCIALTFSLLPWEIALASSIFYYYSYMYFVDFGEFLRRWASDVRWCFNKKLRKMKSQNFRIS
ncbi:MAG: 1-acyl-sn-glycerol-3-phosphate acyltransferase [Bacteroidales bacterium]|nr:1-acyl-sn-glycerol-3-phosphate acyltransferase [Bacteroidales bacterium]